MKNKYPPQYVMAVARMDMDDLDDVNIVETHVYDIIEEGALITASCNILHLITSAETWDELEPKIIKMHNKKMMEKYHD